MDEFEQTNDCRLIPIMQDTAECVQIGWRERIDEEIAGEKGGLIVSELARIVDDAWQIEYS